MTHLAPLTPAQPRPLPPPPPPPPSPPPPPPPSLPPPGPPPSRPDLTPFATRPSSDLPLVLPCIVGSGILQICHPPAATVRPRLRHRGPQMRQPLVAR